MAVTEARDNEKFAKKPRIGASGGNAIEGYSTSFMGTTGGQLAGFGLPPGTVETGSDEKAFKEADKFMKSLKKADEVDVDEVHEVREKEAAKKPTAPGADVAALEAGKGQPAKATEKEEVKTVLAQKNAAADVDPNKVKPAKP